MNDPTDYPPLPDHTGHLHSNFDFCLDRAVTSSSESWPVELYTADQMRAFVDADRAAREPATTPVSSLTDEEILSAAIDATPDATPFDTRYEYTYTQVLALGRAIEARVRSLEPQAKQPLVHSVESTGTPSGAASGGRK